MVMVILVMVTLVMVILVMVTLVMVMVIIIGDGDIGDGDGEMREALTAFTVSKLLFPAVPTSTLPLSVT